VVFRNPIIMKAGCLRKMLEWQVGIESNWSARPGAHGKGLKKWVAPETWAALEATYVRAGRDENWRALFETIDLFRKAAIEVANRLAFEYPLDMDRRVLVYLDKVRKLGKDASRLTG
jgi:aminoglycoside 6-adenylyltransferase